MEHIIDEFIKEVVEVLKRENHDRKCDNKKELDVIFIISSLSQHLLNKELNTFANDLSKCNYSIEYEDIPDGYYDYGKLKITLFEESIKGEEYHYQDLGYAYSIILCYDQRDWGYCQCEPKDKDYRDDKKCCGHGCDWWAPAFRIIKEIAVGHQQNWKGDEHDYWEFEHSFYKSNKEMEMEKTIKDKELKIKRLQDTINKAQEELDQLT